MNSTMWLTGTILNPGVWKYHALPIQRPISLGTNKISLLILGQDIHTSRSGVSHSD